MRIILFEDQAILLDAFKALLEKLGHEVTCFTNAVGFTDILEGLKFDVIITDHKLGKDSPTGYEVCRYMSLYMNGKIPCLLHTSAITEYWPVEFTDGSLGKNITVSCKKAGYLQITDFLKTLEKE